MGVGLQNFATWGEGRRMGVGLEIVEKKLELSTYTTNVFRYSWLSETMSITVLPGERVEGWAWA